MSTDLQWLIVRKWNSFQHITKNGPVLSREPGNLANLHSQKYSGLANSKTVDISANQDGQITITKRQADAKPNQVASATRAVSLKRGTGARRANKIAAAETAGKGYRPDLRQAAVARTSAYTRAQKKNLNPPKTYPVKVRGANKKAAKSASKDGEDVIELD